MNVKNKTHSLIIDYIKGKLSDQAIMELKEIAQKDPAIDLLLNVIEGFIPKAVKSRKQPCQVKSLDAMDVLLEQTMAGHMDSYTNHALNKRYCIYNLPSILILGSIF